jgi:cyclic beta-1,2-glucan synthetase
VVRSRIVSRIGRWFCAVAFMLHEALTSLHAITITLWRLFASGRNLLEWRSAAHVAAQDKTGDDALAHWADMLPSSVIAMGVGAFLVLFRPEAAAPALALIIPWIFAPEIARAIQREPRRERVSEQELDTDYLRQLARRTWLYFEVFAGPADNWLPPDNYQGEPHEEIAHRTSPTNIGMMLLSTASAWDLGFIGRAELAVRTRNAFESLTKLERYRGHFLNWYETHHLRPLEPRYVSTVDSGNLAASLIAYAGCLRDAAATDEFEVQRWTGLRDVALLTAIRARRLGIPECAEGIEAIAGMGRSPPVDESAARESIAIFIRDALPAINEQCSATMEALVETRPEEVRDLNTWLGRLRHQLHEMERDLCTPEPLGEELLGLARDAEALAWQMDFSWLYDADRRLFRIGYNVSTAQLDTHYYDLLASEARIASYFAIAKKDVGYEHWFHLGRPITRASSGLALVSWNGSMFEYLMPRIVLPSEPDTLLGESDRVAVELHRRYHQGEARIWGISESAYGERDPEFRFRYRAFGVPGLGLRRGLAEDLVIAPYASALALAVDPVAAQANLKRLDELGAGGRYGLWEALDLTPERVAGRPGGFAPVNAFMAHHQGMVLCAITNRLLDDVHVRRFLAEPRIALARLLLSERIPHELPSELARIETDTTEPQGIAASDLRMSWQPPATDFPQVQVLGNGRMASRISSRGGGGLFWTGQALTKFVPDATREEDGAWLYIRDEQSEQVWSATRRPCGRDDAEERITFHTHSAEIQRLENKVRTRLQVTVGASEDIELRKIELVNESARSRVLRLTTFCEIALAPPLEYERHPAFSKLFVKSEGIEGANALLFTRRPRRPEDSPPVFLQALIGPDDGLRGVEFETDRRSFIGRGRSVRDPIGALGGLRGSLGWTLDPVCAFQMKINLEPAQKAEFCIVTIAAASREAALAILARHSTMSATRWLIEDAAAEASRAVSRSKISPSELPAIQSLGSLLVYPHGALRASAQTIRANRLGQPSLWGLALSGDLPIVLLREASEETDLLQTLIGAHQLWRRAGLHVDLVILQTLGSAYLEPVRDELSELLQAIGAAEMLGRQGGIHLVFSDQVGADQVRLLEAMAWVVLDGDAGPLASQIERSQPKRLEPPPILRSLAYEPEPERPPPRPEGLEFDNGYGGFDDDGRVYAIHLRDGKSTPAPWVNVIANGNFGTLVTERGGGFTWHTNSGEHRLTPWTNDPVSDRQTEALYLRDEETAQIWSITPAPCGGDAVCEIRHGAGFTQWRQGSRGIEQTLHVSVARSAPVKLIRLTLRNLGERSRRITATYYAEWLMGALAGLERRHVHTRFDPETQSILACNPWNSEFAGRVAFLCASEPAHSFTTDREAFIGGGGDLADPAGLHSWGLDNSEVARGDGCAAYQAHIDLPKGETREMLFVLGEGETEQEALSLARGWRSLPKARSEQERVTDYWDEMLGAIEVRTPDRGLDVMVNRWLLYQSLSSRIFARTGFYQASGAIGFRDQLQDMLSLLHADPGLVREHILECAAHQFTDGDVLHWWHPPSGRGVRTRISDDLLWMPYAAAHYVNVTGDLSILTEEVRFLEAPPLSPEEHDRYASFPSSTEVRPLIEHCERALERVILGSHGLPLIGAGDWNDGMDRVGDKGRGESVWLAWFASVCAASLAQCERRLGRIAQSRFWGERAATWRRNAEKAGWDGEWYRRAFDDEGSPLGSQQNEECWIDSISQSWSVFAGSVSSLSRTALLAAMRELFDEEAGICRLLWAPFEQSLHDPGYIQSYPPGIRENGGQYSHAAAWLGLAFARTGQGDHAHRIFTALNPIGHARDRVASDHYRTEPYALAADIGGVEPHRGKGGWTWYTGAAAWTWRLAVEGILGLTLHEGMLDIAPALPSDWNGFEATLRRGGGTIQLTLRREGLTHGRERPRIFIDGEPHSDERIAFPPRGNTIAVEAVLGDREALTARSERASAQGGI